MCPPAALPNADHHVAALFSAKAAWTGGVLRRNRRWADREIGFARLRDEVAERGFHLLICDTQYVIVCQSGPIRMVC